jgi:uncharacterized NAD(P)/FAD-binding protein YdhS
MAETELAIVGGGASAVLLLAALAREPVAKGMRVDLYERAPGRLGRGIAYSTRQNVHLLNVRAANMSAVEADKDDFAEWAAAKGFKPQDFVPRKLYGDYLGEKFDQAKKILNITVIEADIEAIRKIGKEDYEISYGNKRRSYAIVVQATGNARPIKPKAAGEAAWYFDDPWSADFAALGNLRHIALVGSGLTATDMVLALYAKDFQGKISVVSRHALLPAAHAAPVSWPSFLTPDDYKETPYKLLRRIRAEVGKAADENIPWQAVIDSLRGHTNPVWEGMTKKTRAQFMKRLFTLWNVHRHRMAPQIAQAMEALVKAGRLELVAASVESVAAGPVVKTSAGDIVADAVINCLGYRYQEEGRKYEPSEKIGPARFGEQFETTAIPEIRAQAAEIAARILKHYE